MSETSFPALRIETDRLVIREFAPTDHTAVANLIATEEWDAMPPGTPRELAAVQNWLDVRVSRFRKLGLGIHLAIQDRVSGAHIGAISLFNTDWKRGQVEIGTGIQVGMRGRSYNTEATIAVTNWALTDGGMRRVELRTHPDNTPARRTAENLGYLCEATVLDSTSGKEMLLFSRTEPITQNARTGTKPAN